MSSLKFENVLFFHYRGDRAITLKWWGGWWHDPSVTGVQFGTGSDGSGSGSWGNFSPDHVTSPEVEVVVRGGGGW